MCADRKAFLEAIRANPADDVARLSYADWLDEKGDRGDLDAATAEFIRLGCTGQLRRQIRPAAALWLLGPRPTHGGADRVERFENWKRLVPSVLVMHRAHAALDHGPVALRSGRQVSCAVCLPSPHVRGPMTRAYCADFEFHRGFLKVARFSSVYAAGLSIEAIHHDQPLVEIEIKGLRPALALDLAARLEEVFGEGAAKRFLVRRG